MKKIDGELPTPPEIIKTWEILAPKETSLEQKSCCYKYISRTLFSPKKKRYNNKSNSRI